MDARVPPEAGAPDRVRAALTRITPKLIDAYCIALFAERFSMHDRFSMQIETNLRIFLRIILSELIWGVPRHDFIALTKQKFFSSALNVMQQNEQTSPRLFA
jgi:hypothetical protein